MAGKRHILIVGRYSHQCNDYTSLNLTKLESVEPPCSCNLVIDFLLTLPYSVLDDFDELKIATAYTYQGKTLESFPASIDILENVEVVYETLPGWKEPTIRGKTYEDLPLNARKYVEFIEEFLGYGLKIKYIGTGSSQSEDQLQRYRG